DAALRTRLRARQPVGAAASRRPRRRAGGHPGAARVRGRAPARVATIGSMDVGEDTFYVDVLQRSHDVPVVVDFWADWCGPCKALTPVLEGEVAARDGQVELAKVDVDANPQLAAHYEVRGIPAVKAFRNGRVVAEFVGAQPRPMVESFLDGLLGPS